MIVNLLKAMSHENVEAACCVAVVTYHYLAVCPKELGHILIIEFLSKLLTYFHGDHGSKRGNVTGFNGVTRDFPITKEQ